jgi:predicted RNA methylase
MKIKDEVANVLANSRVEENRLYLPSEQLERSLYMAVNKVLDAIGGKWSRKAKAHLFESSPEDTVEEILQAGEYTHAKSEYNFFETPEPLAKRLIEIAGVNGGTILEPSAGRGAIAKFMNCDCIELEESNRKYLTENGFNLVGRDFLEFTEHYDYIIANPPFSKQRDIDHVTHMIELARKVVVSVMSASILFRTNRKTTEFRELIDSYAGMIISLPEGSFKTSGTMVNACAVVVKK